MTIQLDLVHGGTLRAQRHRFVDDDPAGDRPLAALASPLIIEANGRVVPSATAFQRVLP